MSPLDAWKIVSYQPGIGGIHKLLAQYRIDLAVPGSPTGFAIKLYERQDGLFEAVPSHLLVGAPPKPVPPVRSGTKAASRPSPAAMAAALGYPSEQEALTQTVQTLILMARGPLHTWVENPGF